MSGQGQEVNLTDLDPQQLQEVKKQLDAVRRISKGRITLIPQELDHLTSSYQQLKSAQAKFKACVADIGEIQPSAKGSLLPLVLFGLKLIDQARKCSFPLPARSMSQGQYRITSTLWWMSARDTM